MKRAITGSFIIMSTVFFSCKKDSVSSTASTPLQSFLSSDSSLSIFNAAISRAGETALLQQSSTITIIAPVNNAFRAAGMDLPTINAMPVATLDSMVKYCFLNGSISPDQANNQSYATLDNLPVYGYLDGSTIYFNGNTVNLQTGTTGNAMIYESSKLLIPPYITLPGLLQSDPSLSLFNEAMNRTGIINNLGNGWYTIFAPDNNAFANAGFPDIASIDNADINTLTNIINYHILNAGYFSNNISGSSNVSTDEGASLSIVNNGGVIQLTGNSNSGPATVTTANLLPYQNIIVHKIDGVLLP